MATKTKSAKGLARVTAEGGLMLGRKAVGVMAEAGALTRVNGHTTNGRTAEQKGTKATKPAGGYGSVPVLDVCPSPMNPRQTFDPDELRDLAASIRSVGVLQPVIVRRGPGGTWELIAGERRWRAAKLARLEEIPARVVDVTDEEALEWQARENLDREDLNPVEVAQTYRQLLDRAGWTQATLAKKLNVSQPAIANALRLLKLPEDWQARIIRREITATHALAVLPWLDVPAVLEDAAAAVRDDADLSADDFDSAVEDAARGASRSMDNGRFGERKHFEPTKEQRAALDIREVKMFGVKEARAFNTALWDELEKAAIAAKKKQQREAAAKSPAGGKDTRSRGQRDLVYGRKLYLEKRNWLARTVAARVDLDRDYYDLVRVGLMMCSGGWPQSMMMETLRAEFGIRDDDDFVEACSRIGNLRNESVEKPLVKAILAAIAEEHSNVYGLGPDYELILGWLAGRLKIDFARDWKPTIEFVEGLEEGERKRLFGGVVGLQADLVIATWGGGAPSDLCWVDEEGKIKRPAVWEKKPSKKRAEAKGVA